MPSLAQRLRDEGAKRGRKEGLKQKEKELVIRMCNAKVSIEKICIIAGLSENKVKKYLN